MNNFLPGKTSYAPQSATSNSPVTIAARVAYFDTPHFDISAYFDASATHPPGGGPFSFLATNFYLREGGSSPPDQRMNNFLPGKTSYAPQSATSNSPVTIAAGVAYFDTSHFDISAYFDAQTRTARASASGPSPPAT